MAKNVRNLLIAGAVALLTGAALGFLNAYVSARTGQPSASGPSTWVLPAVLAIFTYVILSGVSGNRKVSIAGSSDRERALSFAAEPGQSLLVLSREGFVGKAVGVNLYVDGVLIAQLKSPRFTAVSVAPGTHRITADCVSNGGAMRSEPFEVQCSQGETIVLQLGMVMGLTKGALKFERRTDLDAVRNKLRSMPMVAPEPRAAA